MFWSPAPYLTASIRFDASWRLWTWKASLDVDVATSRHQEHVGAQFYEPFFP